MRPGGQPDWLEPAKNRWHTREHTCQTMEPFVWTILPGEPNIHRKRMDPIQAAIGYGGAVEFRMPGTDEDGCIQVIVCPGKKSTPNEVARQLFHKIVLPKMPNGLRPKLNGPVVIARMASTGEYIDIDTDMTASSFAIHVQNALYRARSAAPLKTS